MSEAIQNAYRDKTGRVLFVSDGISDGRSWGVFYRKPSGGLKRVVSKYLPMVATRQEAQRNLNLYAGRHAMKFLKEIGDVQS
jgi:ribosomal protein L13